MNFQLHSAKYVYDLAGSQNDDAQLALFSQSDIGLHIPKYPLQTHTALLDELRRVDLRFKQQEALFWLLENTNNKSLDACISLQKINPLNHSANLVWLVDKDVHLETELAGLIAPILDFAFNQLGLHRIEAKIVNVPSTHATGLNNAGFSYEGVLPKQLEFNSKWLDLHLYSLLASEFIN